MRPAHTETDIVSGLETAQRYPGTVFIASDLDQTVDDRNIQSIIDRFKSIDRGFQIFETDRRNRHGIVDLEVGESNTSVDVKNFENREKTIQISSGNQTREVTVEGKSVETIDLESQTGRNIVELEEDDFSRDNTAYFYIPEARNIDVAFISSQENPYLAKAFELIDFTSFTYYSPPVDQDINADIYIIGHSEGILSQTIRDIEEDVRDGSNLVLFGNPGFSDLNMQDLPVEDEGSNKNETVTIKKPVEASLGEVEIREVAQNSGERYSARSNALIKSEYGNGEFLLYNIDDQSFRNNFLYPVFWKELSRGMSDKPSITESNRETGEELNRESITAPDGKEYSGRHKLTQTGFYETSQGTTAVNMLSEDESLRDQIEIEEGNIAGDAAEMSLQKYIIALILLLVIAELAYLYRLGDLK